MAKPTLVAPMSMLLEAGEVAELLEISQATLRRWASRFDAFLDRPADENAVGPCYSGNDLETLARIKGWLEEGWTYDQVATKLHEARTAAPAEEALEGDVTAWEAHPLPDDEPVIEFADTEPARALQTADALNPAARFVRDAIQGLTDTQQIILNSQQASRSLMGVMIQDNLNLKTEAAGLRDRMLEMEREMAEQRRRHSDYRERMETRVHVLEDAIARLMTAAPAAAPPPAARPAAQPAAPAEPERRGFWSRLLGG